MHSAPSVSYPVGRSRVMAALVAGFWAAGAASAAIWCFQADQAGWRQAVEGVAVAAAGVFAARAWWGGATGELAWDGHAWSWQEGSATGEVRVALDLQKYLLVELRGTGFSGPLHWLWLERARCPGRWSDLRRAVYSRARPDALAGTMPPPAKP